MTLDDLKARLPDFAKDVRLNISSLVNEDVLGVQTKWGLLLSCAIATRNAEIAQAFGAEASAHLTTEYYEAARAAASIMAMNNVYYRFVHLASNKEYGKMPAKLRMSVIGNPGVPKVDFELWSLGVSAINGCGMCIDAHEKVLRDGGISAEAIHTAVRYASIVQSAAVALEASALPAKA